MSALTTLLFGPQVVERTWSLASTVRWTRLCWSAQ
jgi:hypothetical protein